MNIRKRSRTPGRTRRFQHFENGYTGFAAGSRDGYEAGRRLGIEAASLLFDGFSIIIPIQKVHEEMVPFIRWLEAVTPHPYEIIVADAARNEMNKDYARVRAGAVRYIADDENLGIVPLMNKAIRAARGQLLSVLPCHSEIYEGWIHTMQAELESSAESGVVYTDLSRSEMPSLMFRKETWHLVSRKNWGKAGTLQEWFLLLRQCMMDSGKSVKEISQTHA